MMMYIAGMRGIIDFILHVDVQLLDAVRTYHTGVHGILFAIVFAETGLVVTPFLPGDSLLFACGALSANGTLDVRIVWALWTTAAILGDAMNYAVGRYVGPKVFRAEDRSGLLHKLLN